MQWPSSCDGKHWSIWKIGNGINWLDFKLRESENGGNDYWGSFDFVIGEVDHNSWCESDTVSWLIQGYHIMNFEIIDEEGQKAASQPKSKTYLLHTENFNGFCYSLGLFFPMILLKLLKTRFFFSLIKHFVDNPSG